MSEVKQRNRMNFKLLPGDQYLIPLLPAWQRPFVVGRWPNYDHLAAQHGISIGTVKSRVHRARSAIIELRAKAAANDLIRAEAAANDM